MDEGLKNLIQKAKHGDVESMVMVGDCYNRGLHTEKDTGLSHYYYKMAADCGHSEAAFMVGIDYMNGIGVKTDIRLAVQHIKSAADKGVAEAQYILANLYKSGNIRCMGKDKKAFSYFEKAARQGNADAQVALGDCYMLGEGVDSDIDCALFWLACAYLKGDSSPKCSNEASSVLIL